MLIIIEGPDGAGKTTYLEQLLKSIPGSKTMHFTKPYTEEEAYNYYKVYAGAIMAIKPAEVMIFDRSWYSDLVYGPVMRGRVEMTQLHADMLDSLAIANGGGLVIYCTAPVRTLWSRCQKRGETHIPNIEKLEALHKAYENIMSEKHLLPIFRVDTSK